MKVKNLRKQILDNFVNLIVAYAKAYHCQVIAIERLVFRDIPKWKNKKGIRKFSQWFYSKFSKRLEEKARIYGLKVIKVNPKNTSKVCAKCGYVGKLEGLVFKCSCGVYDRDYNLSLNIAKRALCPAKPEAYMVGDIPSRFPSRLVRMEGSALLTVIKPFKLLAWLKVVHTSYLKLQKLFRWINSDKYD